MKAVQIARAALLSVNLIPEPCGAACAVTSAFIHEAFTGLAALIAAHISVYRGQYWPASRSVQWKGGLFDVLWNFPPSPLILNFSCSMH